MMDANITEKQFSQMIYDLAKAFNWVVYHTWYAKHSAYGFPDLTLVREKSDNTVELIFFEVKQEKGRLTWDQEKWLYLLGRVPGVIARCVRPSNWDEIALLLKD